MNQFQGKSFDSDRSLDELAKQVEQKSFEAERKKRQKLASKEKKRQQRDLKKRRQILSKLVAPAILIITILIGWLLSFFAQR